MTHGSLNGLESDFRLEELMEIEVMDVAEFLLMDLVEVEE
jgi:hypothetical protein